VRVSVIGVGGMGSFHARTLASLGGVEVTAVADVYEPNARRIAEELGCEYSLDPIALAAQGGVDGIVIASPDDTHAELAIAAMGTGAFVLCEKPLASLVSDAERVVATEVALGRRVIQMGFMREFDPAHVQLRERLPALGTLDYLRAVHRNANRERRPLEQIVVQSMVHDVHSVRFLSGAEITSVIAFGAGAENGSFRHVLARAELSSGGHAALEFDDGGFGYEVTVEVLGRDGDVLTSPPLRAVTRQEGSVNTFLGNDWFGWFADAYRIQNQAWVDSIRAGVAVGSSTWDGYVAQVVVQAMMESLATGVSVAIETVPRPSIYG
jgi:myo-inositol 2-dehydrogenase/D-chiro-inositol 1-dehydrogenase